MLIEPRDPWILGTDSGHGLSALRMAESSISAWDGVLPFYRSTGTSLFLSFPLQKFPVIPKSEECIKPLCTHPPAPKLSNILPVSFRFWRGGTDGGWSKHIADAVSFPSHTPQYVSPADEHSAVLILSKINRNSLIQLSTQSMFHFLLGLLLSPFLRKMQKHKRNIKMRRRKRTPAPDDAHSGQGPLMNQQLPPTVLIVCELLQFK